MEMHMLLEKRVIKQCRYIALLLAYFQGIVLFHWALLFSEILLNYFFQPLGCILKRTYSYYKF